MEVLNLPPEYSFEFREVGEQASNADRRVSRIRFKKGLTTKGMQLLINMPKEIGKDEINTKVSFYVLALDRPSQQRLATAKSQSLLAYLAMLAHALAVVWPFLAVREFGMAARGWTSGAIAGGRSLRTGP